jgi:hypothetical protein
MDPGPALADLNQRPVHKGADNLRRNIDEPAVLDAIVQVNPEKRIGLREYETWLPRLASRLVIGPCLRVVRLGRIAACRREKLFA